MISLKNTIRPKLLCFTFMVVLLSSYQVSWSQSLSEDNKYSQNNNQIKLMVPFTPGTGMDIIARSISQPLSHSLGRPVIVENRPGASGNIGTELVVRSKPDGNTILVTASTVVMNRALYKNLSFDPIKDLSPITLAATGELVLAVPEKSPYKDLKALIRGAQRSPGKLTYGSPGIGTPHHLSMELFETETHTKLLHIPYRGTAPAFTDLIGNHIDAMFIPVHVANEYIKSGKIRALAIGSDKRNPRIPELSTFKELGYENINIKIWYGFMLPVGVPTDEATRIGIALRKILSDQNLKTTFETQGLDQTTSTAEEFKNLINTDATRWTRVIREQGLTAE